MMSIGRDYTIFRAWVSIRPRRRTAWRLFPQDLALQGEGDGFGAVGDAQLREDEAQVLLDADFGDAENTAVFLFVPGVEIYSNGTMR